MSRLNDLIRQLRAQNPALADDIDREVSALADRRAFGLNFERHTPEAVELPGRRVRRGDKVRILQPRGTAPMIADERLWFVDRIDKAESMRTATLVSRDGETATSDVDDLVVVTEFRDPIYPGLVSTGRIERGGDQPFHTVINAENYHALQALLFTHRGVVDCVYIDPPYNTGARDWKYNNDYVETDDLYRHSKWLAFMERRLLLAKELLDPDESVLVVTIDEKEVNRLSLLLEQIFPEAIIQTVTIVINPSGTSRDFLSRVDEYAIFCFIGDARPHATDDDFLSDVEADGGKIGSQGIRWEWLLRGGGTWYRETRRNLCYPVLLNSDRTQIVRAGEPLQGREEDRPLEIDGCPVAWPTRSDGRLGIWRVDAEKLNTLAARGYTKISSKPHAEQPTLRYLLAGTVERIESGQLLVTGKGERGEVQVEFPSAPISKCAKTVWLRGRHTAGGAGGANLVNLLLGSRGNFQFPKSLYAVEDVLRVAVGRKSDAIVLDFFAGSGTTSHAVARLNAEDGGRRQSICITNNEVASIEQKTLREAQLRPGDPAWEERGIYELVTKPRLSVAVTGRSADGKPIGGSYRFSNEFPIADGLNANVEFFTLTYETPLQVVSNREFEKIAPLLWMRAGARGRRIMAITAGWSVADTYGVIKDFDHTDVFSRTG